MYARLGAWVCVGVDGLMVGSVGASGRVDECVYVFLLGRLVGCWHRIDWLNRRMDGRTNRYFSR